MGNAATSWKTTELWRVLERCTDHGAEAVKAALSADPCMSTIEVWLKHAAPEGTSDFTLHDAEHGYRVAQRMAEVLPAHVRPKLSSYEIALLLLSAYLHDIGMTPRRGLVKGLWNYLAFGPGQADALNTLPVGMWNEFSEFRRYLGDNGVEPGLLAQTPDASSRGMVDELVAYYCRRRHNAWSKAWIDEHLQGQRLGEFHSWLDDLTDLCLSHHYGKDRLLSERFDPRLVSNTGEMVNLRYLACVLRVADILENDPKRTPEIVFQQRDVQSSSRIYWFKDHEFRCKIEPSESGDSRKLIVSARPKRAAMERACRETMDAIATELKLCRAIHEEKPFYLARGLRCEQYHWDLLDLVTDDIRNANNNYVYIDGAFRPDTKRILQLLSGNALYEDPLAAIREVLQNAFDAIREIVAYERLIFWDNLRLDQQKVYDWSSHDDAPRTVTLRLESDPQPDGTQAYWLTCMDEGIGMSRSILEHHLLVSGATPRAELRELERRCETAGFSLGRTGQFGIGVLSYFIIARQVQIWTRRSPYAGGDDGTGWYFETEGVGSFGELRKAPDMRPGTKVRLLLRESQFSSNVKEWAQRLSQYIRESLVRIPCRFRFDGTAVGSEEVTLERGWTSGPVDWFDLLMDEVKPRSGPEVGKESFVSLESRQAREAEERAWDQIRKEMRSTIRWEEVSGELPDHLGHYRVHLAYFELQGGPSLTFLRLSQEGGRLLCQAFKRGLYSGGHQLVKVAWKGISTENDGFLYELTSELYRSLMVIEIDLTNPKAGTISVNRNKFESSSILSSHVIKVYEAVVSALRELASRIAKGKHLLISQGCVSFDLNVRTPNLYWTWLSRRGGVAEIVHITEPFLITADRQGSLLSLRATSSQWILGKSVKVMELPPIASYGGSEANLIAPSTYLCIANQVVRSVSTPAEESARVLFSTAKPDMLHPWISMCKFPPLWRGVLGAQPATNSSLIRLNIDNTAVALADQDTLERFDSSPRVGDLYDIASTSDQRELSELGAAAAWLVACAIESVNNPDLWKALRELKNNVLRRVWHLVLGATADEHTPILLIVGESVVKLSLSGYEDSLSLAAAKHLIPDPGPEWTIRTLPDESAQPTGSVESTRTRASSSSEKTKQRSSGPKPSSTKRRR